MPSPIVSAYSFRQFRKREMQISAFTSRVRTDKRRRLRHANAFSRDLRNAIYHDTITAVAQLSQSPEFYNQFRDTTDYGTCANVHKFLRSNFIYLRDPANRQKLQLPSRFLRTLHGDCKSYSILCFSILHCCGVPVAYKFASYPHPTTGKVKKVPTHIYCISGNIIIDGTSPLFNFEKQPGYSFTHNPMRVETLSGSDFTASEVLKLTDDEILSSEAAGKFYGEMKAMQPQQRRRFLRQFNPANRQKLIRSVKSYAKQQQLNHCAPGDGIGAVAGVDESDFVADDSSEPIAGKRRDARKAKRTARKQARKEGMSKKAARQIGRATKKETKGKTERQKIKAEILRAKATGDKAALKAAKAKRKANIKSNLKKVGKTFAKINPVLAAGRGAFLGMVRLNLRGFASNMSEMLKDNAGGDLRKKWEAIGGKWSRLTKAIDKGKGKKALLGKRNISDELNDIYGNRGVNGSDFIADGGATAITGAAAAPVLAAIVPIIVKFLKGKGQDTTDLEGDVIDATSSESKGRLAKFVDKVADWVDDHPVIDDALEAGRTTLAEKFEAKAEDILGKGETDPEAEESESGVSPLVWLVGGGIAIYAIKKAA